MRYTHSQEKAIYTRDKSLLLSAAAGSGKTAVLVARILDIISDESNDINIDDLLIVTFTNLAASQMKERIYKATSALIKEQPANKKLKKQLLYLPGAKIKTIHSFCLDIIKDNIDSLDIPVGFRIAEETEENTIKNKVLDEFTEEMYKSGNSAFFDIINTYAYGRDDSEFYDLMLYLEKYIESIPNKDEYIKMCLKNIETASTDFSKSVYSDIILTHIRHLLKFYILKYDAAIEESELSPDFDVFTPFFKEEKNFLLKLYTEKDIFQIKKLAEEYSFPARPTKKRGTDATFFADIRDSFKKKGLPNIISSVNSTKATEQDNQEEILIHLKNIFSLVEDFHNRLMCEKRRRNVITFGDFEHLAYSLLKNKDGSPSTLANSIKENYYEILIDEYQDTSDLQNTIFELISKDGKNLFMVGDVKQSIYKFRHAKPELFIGKATDFEKDGKTSELIKLTENFRSRHQVLDSVNSVFKNIMTIETSMTDYTKEMLVEGLLQNEHEKNNYNTEVLIYEGAKKGEDAPDNSNEGYMIANRIKELISDKFMIWDSKNSVHRPIEYQDIVILTRDMTENSRLIYNSLLENGIPASGEFEGGYYLTPEIMIIMNILKAINNPYEELSLISMLKSPPFHFTETELMTVKMLNDKVPFFDALKEDNNKKSVKAVNFIKDFSKLSEIMNISEFVLEVYKKLEIYEHFSAFSGYEQRIFNLDIFYKTACDFEKNNSGSLKSFLIFLDTASKSPKKVKNIYESKNSNSVKLLTIHKSKGLEFPVVFVAGLGKNLRGKDNTAKIIAHTDYGIGMDYISSEKLYLNSTLCKNAVKTAMAYEQISEELRVLYVAMTRAKEKLILTGNVSNMEKKENLWETVKKCGGHSLYSLFENSNYLDWIMPVAKYSSFFEVEIKDEIKPLEAPDSDDETAYEIPLNKAVFFQYPDISRTQLPMKVTVSFANKLAKNEEDASKQIFNISELEEVESEYIGNEYGTYFHKMFELCDIDAIKNGESVKDITNRLIENQIIDYMPYTDEVIAGIEQFFASDIGKELLLSSNINKETPFMVRINANKVFSSDVNEEILLQGATDCWFEIGDEITLIDFKTDKNPNEEKIRKNYTKQIELYAYALQKITGMKVKKKIIYTVRNANCIEV